MRRNARRFDLFEKECCKPYARLADALNRQPYDVSAGVEFAVRAGNAVFELQQIVAVTVVTYIFGFTFVDVIVLNPNYA